MSWSEGRRLVLSYRQWVCFPGLVVSLCLLLANGGRLNGEAVDEPHGGSLDAMRGYPQPAGWTLPVGSRQLFRAEVYGGGEAEGAIWRITGVSGTKQHKGKLKRLDGTPVAYYTFRPREGGQYSITCEFRRAGGPGASVSWDVHVEDVLPAPHGRVVGSSELGTMVFIPGGTFVVGRTDDTPIEDLPEIERWRALPRQAVEVSSFYIGKYPVTVAEFCEFLSEAGEGAKRYLAGTRTLSVDPHSGLYAPRGSLGYVPAHGVTYAGASAYCTWLSLRTGKTYRLPTEVEWEYAARGEEGREYPWGDEEPVPGGRSRRTGRMEEYGVHPGEPEGWGWRNVGSFPAGNTPLGVADMPGRLMEWCTCSHDAGHTARATRAHGASGAPCIAGRDGGLYALRGALGGASWDGWWGNWYYVSSAWRRCTVIPDWAPEITGFRVAMGLTLSTGDARPGNPETPGTP